MNRTTIKVDSEQSKKLTRLSVLLDIKKEDLIYEFLENELKPYMDKIFTMRFGETHKKINK